MISRQYLSHLLRLTAWSLLFQIVATFPAALAAPDDERRTVAILIFDGVQIIDFTGPYEVFGQAGFEVFTVSADGEPITTHMGMRVVPTHSLATSPRTSIVVLPGGAVPHRLDGEDPRLEWIRKVAGESDAVLSVCNGVFFLASADLLRGQRATTYAPMLDHLAHFAPGVTVVRDERVVDNGRILTAGGLSAGIDGALHLVERYLGKARAREVALNMEYDWRPAGDFVRARLADVHVQKILDVNPPARRRISEVYEGDETRWDLRWRIRWPGDAATMRQQIRAAARGGGWKLQESQGQPGDRWAFEDAGGVAWLGEARVEALENGELRLSVSVRRRSDTSPDPVTSKKDP